MARKRNRLATLLQDFGEKYELPQKLDSDDLGADLGIPDGNQTIFVSYSFDASEDSYEFGAALGKVEENEKYKFSWEVLNSEPIRGITERIDAEGKYLITGSRDGLTELSDAEIQKRYLDDVSRITEANQQFKGFFKRLFGSK